MDKPAQPSAAAVQAARLVYPPWENNEWDKPDNRAYHDKVWAFAIQIQNRTWRARWKCWRAGVKMP